QTAMMGEIKPEVLAEYLKAIPAGRFGTPVDIANAVLFLASEESNYITGQVLPVTGGGGGLLFCGSPAGLYPCAIPTRWKKTNHPTRTRHDHDAVRGAMEFRDVRDVAFGSRGVRPARHRTFGFRLQAVRLDHAEARSGSRTEQGQHRGRYR